MENKRKARLEALRKLASVSNSKPHTSNDVDYFNDIKNKRNSRRKKIMEKYKNSSPIDEHMKSNNEQYDISHEGMSQEEKEIAAEKEYHKKRKESGLE